MFCRSSQTINQDKLLLIIVLITFFLVIIFPYVYAMVYSAYKTGYVFGGFLLNPIDGNSYLAKMYQGWLGSWQFRLPYTREAEKGAYLFLFYLFLGHIAKMIGIPLIFMFHIARVIAAMFMLYILFYFYRNTLIEPSYYRCAFILSSFGSGMGWLASQIGLFTSDFWVAETFPFLSAYANPHFPLGIAILLILVDPVSLKQFSTAKIHIWVYVKDLFLTILLTLMTPFGSLLAFILNGVIILQRIFRGETIFQKLWGDVYFYRLLGITFGAGPLLYYYWIVIHNDPWLVGWNIQNNTPSPPLYDLVISLSPAVFLALFPIKKLITKRDRHWWFLFLWALIGGLLVYIPFGLQRRFMLGLYIPWAGLAGIASGDVLSRYRWSSRLLVGVIFVFSYTTNIMVITSSLYGIRNHSSMLYLQSDEVHALRWIEENTSQDAVILASPDFGMFIPAYTGRRVIYGHPFETVNAEEMERWIFKFFNETRDSSDIEILSCVDYVFIGPREEAIGGIPGWLKIPLAYENQGVKIFRVKQ